MRRRFGPGIFVTAAFIGPGTLTTASMAGAQYGFILLWALVFSIVATLVLQEMSARLGLLSRLGLGGALRSAIRMPVARYVVFTLIVLAIGVGNAAYQAGNILGAAIGAEVFTGYATSTLSLAIGLAAMLLLGVGRYRLIEVFLICLVLLMSIVFLVTVSMHPPDWSLLLDQAFEFRIPEHSTLIIIALIGTTVVPYNLFLHASTVPEKWSSEIPLERALAESRWDTGLSIGLGGLITFCILSTSATAFYPLDEPLTATTISRQLEPLLGASAKYFFALGTLAAGLTSAITAPLAAAYAVSGVMGWQNDLRDWRFRLTWMVVLGTGTLFAMLETRPLAAIVLAQFANGLLLPVIALALLWLVNNRSLMGNHRNNLAMNLIALAVILICIVLGGSKLLSIVS